MLIYPPAPSVEQERYGVLPVDFLLETVLYSGLEWFRTDPKAPALVFDWLRTPWLAEKYGDAKVNEIADFLKKYELPIVQHFSLIDQTRPCLSIQLLDGDENTERAAMSDHEGVVDQMNGANEVTGRKDKRYAPITDNIHIGIHVINTPDLAKYLYYLVVYILNAYKPQLEERGLQLGTFRATDISRLNDFLPENMYSRFINFTIFNIALFDAGSVPIIDKIVGLSIGAGAVTITGAPLPTCSDTDVSAEIVTETFGLQACDIRQGSK